jgi:hypothetical protein
MRTIALVIVATFALSGCAALVEVAALDEAGVGATAAEGAGGTFAATNVALSDSLSEDVTGGLNSGTREGALSNAFSDLTDGGQRPAQLNLSSQGTISARGQPVASLDSAGNITASGKKIGFVNAEDTRLYEYLSDGSEKPVAVLRGFVRQNGVELISQTDGTVVRIMRSDVVLDVIGIRDGQYLVRLADGEEGLVASGAVDTLALLGLTQLIAGCPDDNHEGAVVRRSGEVVRFKDCKKQDGAFVLSADGADTIIDSYDVVTVLTGGGIPGVQGDGADQRLVTYAQSAAVAAGMNPGEQAMNFLATTPYIPALEQARYQPGQTNPFVERRQMTDAPQFEARAERPQDRPDEPFQRQDRRQDMGSQAFQARQDFARPVPPGPVAGRPAFFTQQPRMPMQRPGGYMVRQQYAGGRGYSEGPRRSFGNR